MSSSLKKKLTSVQERTAARAALHGNIERENAAKEAAAAAREPFDKFHDQVEHAQALARAAQERLQAIDAAEAELVKSWPPRDLTPEEKGKRREAEEDLARTVRTLRATEANAQAARKLLDEATLALNPIVKDIDVAIAAVMVEEGQMALDHLSESWRDIVDWRPNHRQRLSRRRAQRRISSGSLAMFTAMHCPIALWQNGRSVTGVTYQSCGSS